MKRLAIALLIALAGVVASLGNAGYREHDLNCFWNAGRAVLEGRDPYDPVTWEAVTRASAIGPSGVARRDPCPGRFAYPLWTAIVMVPFAALPLVPAAAAWLALNIGAAVAGLDLCWRAVRGPRRSAPLFAILVVFSLPFWRLLVLGQVTGVLLGLVGLSAYLLARRDDRAGLALGALALKPQVVAILGPIAVVRAVAVGRARVAIWAVAVVLALGVAALAVDPGWAGRWLDGIAVQRADQARGLPTAWALAGELGDPLLALPLVGGLALGTWWTVRRAALDEVRVMALVLPFSLLLAPYLHSYDHLLLALPWAAVIADAARLRPRARSAALAALVLSASLLPWSFYALRFTADRDTLNAIPPALTALLLAATTRVSSARTP